MQNKSNKNNLNEDALKNYVKEAVNYLTENGERYIPENGRFSPFEVQLDVAGTQNSGYMAVKFDPRDFKTQRLLQIGVSRNGSDKLISRYPIKGTKSEILEYLKNKNSIDEIFNHITELSNKVDNLYN